MFAISHLEAAGYIWMLFTLYVAVPCLIQTYKDWNRQ